MVVALVVPPRLLFWTGGDLAETRGDVETSDESYGTQHGCTLKESCSVGGESSTLWYMPALLCQVFLLFITSFFKKEK